MSSIQYILKAPGIVWVTVLSAALRESIHECVCVWITCNDIILTRVTIHCQNAFFSQACEIDISFTNIPGIFSQGRISLGPFIRVISGVSTTKWWCKYTGVNIQYKEVMKALCFEPLSYSL